MPILPPIPTGTIPKSNLETGKAPTKKKTTTQTTTSSDAVKNEKYGISGKSVTVNGVTYKYAGPQFSSLAKNIYVYLYKGIGKLPGINNIYGVAAVMGNMSIESGMIPGRLQSDYSRGYSASYAYTKEVDLGTSKNFVNDSKGYGLCQWTYYTRKQNLYNYGSAPTKLNFSIGSWLRQVGFCLYEMRTGYSSTWKKVRNANKENLYSVVEYVCKHYEQPADLSKKQIDNRYRKALEFLKKYAHVDTSEYPKVDDPTVDNITTDDTDNFEYAQVFTPTAVIGASDTAKQYKETELSGTVMGADLARLEKLVAKDLNAKAAKKTTIKKLKSNFNNKKLTTLTSAGTKSKVATVKSSLGISIERIYDFYLTANNIIKDYKKPNNREAKQVYETLLKNIPSRYAASMLKYYAIKEDVNNIFETSQWNDNFLSNLLNSQGEIEKKKGELSDLTEDISEIIENYVNQINELNDKLNNLENEIINQNELMEKVLPSYKIILNEDNNFLLKINTIENNLNNSFKDNFSNSYKYWNLNILDNPQSLLFWFDFLDTKGDLEEYSVPNVGSRAKAINDSNINAIYYKDTPLIIYYSDSDDIVNYDKTGYNYVNISGPIKNSFVQSTLNISAKDMVDDYLYNYGYCTENINLTTVPIYYLEPNTRVFIYDEISHLEGEFLVNKLTIPITYNGSMSIEATKAPERLY